MHVAAAAAGSLCVLCMYVYESMCMYMYESMCMYVHAYMYIVIVQNTQEYNNDSPEAGEENSTHKISDS